MADHTTPDAPEAYDASTEAMSPPEAPAASTAPAPPRSGAIPIVALVLGIVGAVLAVLPGANFAAWIPAIGAIVFGIIGLALKMPRKGFSIAALVLGPVAWLVAIVVSVGLILGAADSTLPSAAVGDEPDAPAAEEPLAEPEPAEEPEPVEEPDPEFGTRSNPAPAGSTVEISDNSGVIWEIAFGELVLDAGAAIADENQFNEPADDGFQYLMVPVTYTYLGDESGLPWIDVTIEYVSAAGTTHTTSDALVVAPNEITDINELYEGASATGNVVIMVPSENVEGGSWAVSALFGDPFFVSVV